MTLTQSLVVEPASNSDCYETTKWKFAKVKRRKIPVTQNIHVARYHTFTGFEYVCVVIYLSVHKVTNCLWFTIFWSIDLQTYSRSAIFMSTATITVTDKDFAGVGAGITIFGSHGPSTNLSGPEYLTGISLIVHGYSLTLRTTKATSLT